jgi:hypothetical protein
LHIVLRRIAFEPSNAMRDGKLRPVQVRVNKPGVMVQARTGYYGTKPAEAAAVRTADVLDPNRAQLVQSIAGLLPSAGLPLRVALAPFAASGRSNTTVAIVIGIRPPHPSLLSDDRPVRAVELLTAVFTPDGDEKAVFRQSAEIALRPDPGDTGSYDILSFVDLPAGRYQVRIAAHDRASGRKGSVFADVVVPDYRSGPLSLSPIVLSVTGSSIPNPTSSMVSLLPAAPTTRREFFAHESVAACLRVYEVGPKPTRLRVSIELRGAEGRLRTPDLRTIDVEHFTAVDSHPGTSSTEPPLWAADVTYQIPLSTLSPGARVLTVDVSLGATLKRRELGFIVK